MHFQNFLDQPLATYTKQISRAGVYADHITVYALAKCLNCAILILSNISGNSQITQTLIHEEGSKILALGHLEELTHYVSITKL